MVCHLKVKYDFAAHKTTRGLPEIVQFGWCVWSHCFVYFNLWCAIMHALPRTTFYAISLCNKQRNNLLIYSAARFYFTRQIYCVDKKKNSIISTGWEKVPCCLRIELLFYGEWNGWRMSKASQVISLISTNTHRLQYTNNVTKSHVKPRFHIKTIYAARFVCMLLST